jgi:hypothetical protein
MPLAYRALVLSSCLAHDAHPSPNLPVLTRPSDIACVLHGRGGAPEILVPHATITSLQNRAVPTSMWTGEPGALDLWLMLMTGATATTATSVDAPAAAA